MFFNYELLFKIWDSNMKPVLHCYEFLFLRKLDSDPEFWAKIKSTVLRDNECCLKAVPHKLWFVAVTISETKDRFPSFIKKTLASNPFYHPSPADCLLTRYIQHHEFVEMHLDSIFKPADNCSLPKELFRCPNLKVLSLKYNYLEELPPDVGKLQNLEYLALTNNRLQNSAIPYTLTFCRKLKVLYLDHNLLDALPGFLLSMSSLRTVHRHGNHNYFKATFMWYHTDVNERILAIPENNSSPPKLKSLKRLSATAIFAAKLNFFADAIVPSLLRDYMCNIYYDFNICYKCFTANPVNQAGYKVYTFKNPYLGNFCVPFQHWACSLECAEAIEIPAREEQLLAAMEQDREYRKHVQEAHMPLYENKSFMDNFSCNIL